MKNPMAGRRKQTTSSEGYPEKNRVEPEGYPEAQSPVTASNEPGHTADLDRENLMEQILARDNLKMALKRVESNKGKHGVDGMQTGELRSFLKTNWEPLRQELLNGTYVPEPVRRVEIPKGDGSKRQLGIPTVLDRFIQQAMAQSLNRIFDKDFSASSYGFRPGRSAHDALKAARVHIQNGYTTVVDIDLEKFFDRVNHDKLMSLVARKVKDKRVLRLIRRYLEAGALVEGVRVQNEEGTPQGGPLSPLLANIMLDEMDKELERRGHKFCRYADDLNIYVQSRKAGNRVMESVSGYLQNVLKLRVNREKSAVGSPLRRKFLGMSFYVNNKKEVRNRVHEKSFQKYKSKVREITSRSNAMSLEVRIERVSRLNRGWANYFGLADLRNRAKELDEWTRRRLRMCQWKQWKKIKTRHENLKRLGIDRQKAWEFANTRKGYWRISNSPILKTSMTNKYFEGIGFTSLYSCLGN